MASKTKTLEKYEVFAAQAEQIATICRMLNDAGYVKSTVEQYEEQIRNGEELSEWDLNSYEQAKIKMEINIAAQEAVMKLITK